MSATVKLDKIQFYNYPPQKAPAKRNKKQRPPLLEECFGDSQNPTPPCSTVPLRDSSRQVNDSPLSSKVAMLEDVVDINDISGIEDTSVIEGMSAKDDISISSDDTFSPHSDFSSPDDMTPLPTSQRAVAATCSLDEALSEHGDSDLEMNKTRPWGTSHPSDSDSPQHSLPCYDKSLAQLLQPYMRPSDVKTGGEHAGSSPRTGTSKPNLVEEQVQTTNAKEHVIKLSLTSHDPSDREMLTGATLTVVNVKTILKSSDFDIFELEARVQALPATISNQHSSSRSRRQNFWGQNSRKALRRSRYDAWDNQDALSLYEWRREGKSWPWIEKKFPKRTLATLKTRWYMVHSQMQAKAGKI